MKAELDIRFLNLALHVSLAFPARLVIKYWGCGFTTIPKGQHTTMCIRLDIYISGIT